MDAMLKRS